MKNKKGFTLIELVIVIAIIGVLAAILVPLVLQYLTKSRLATANTNAKVAYNSVKQTLTDFETKGDSQSAAGLGTIDCTGSAPTDKVALAAYNAFSPNGADSGEVYIDTTTINGQAGVLFVQWRKNSTDLTVGQFPEPAKDLDYVIPTWGTWLTLTEN